MDIPNIENIQYIEEKVNIKEAYSEPRLVLKSKRKNRKGLKPKKIEKKIKKIATRFKSKLRLRTRSKKKIEKKIKKIATRFKSKLKLRTKPKKENRKKPKREDKQIALVDLIVHIDGPTVYATQHQPTFSKKFKEIEMNLIEVIINEAKTFFKEHQNLAMKNFDSLIEKWIHQISTQYKSIYVKDSKKRGKNVTLVFQIGKISKIFNIERKVFEKQKDFFCKDELLDNLLYYTGTAILRNCYRDEIDKTKQQEKAKTDLSI